MHSGAVRGALESVLGPGYVMDRRKHMHNSSSQGDQEFHKDCQRGKSLTGHRPRCAMVFYAPAGCTAEMGPTEVLRDRLQLAVGETVILLHPLLP